MFDKRSSTLPKNGRRLADLSGLSAPELVALAQAGDLEAFDPLYRRYAPELLRYAIRKAQGDRAVGEDLAAEAWKLAVADIGSFHNLGERGFAKWMYSIVKRCNGRRIQSLVRHPNQFELWVSYQDAASAEDDGTDWQELRGQLDAALGELPPLAYDVAKLRLDGLNNGEIAQRTGMSLDQVRAAWTVAFDLLRQRLAPRAGAKRHAVHRRRNGHAKRPSSLTLAATVDRAGFLAVARSLPTAARRVALLKLENLPNAEIAKILDCPTNTVASAWRRACLAFADAGLMTTTPKRSAIPAGAVALAELTPEQALRAAVDGLSPAMRRIVALHLDGLTHTQIAAAVGRTAGTVGSTLFSAKRLLASQSVRLP